MVRFETKNQLNKLITKVFGIAGRLRVRERHPRLLEREGLMVSENTAFNIIQGLETQDYPMKMMTANEGLDLIYTRDGYVKIVVCYSRFLLHFNKAASQDIAKEAKAVSRDAACHDDNKTPKKHKTVSNDAAIKATTKDGATQKGTDDVIVVKDPCPPKVKEIYYLGSDSEEEGAKQLMELATEKIPSNRVLPCTIPPKIIYTCNTKMLSTVYLLASALDNALWFACLQCSSELLIVNLRNLCQELSKSPQNQMDPQSYVNNHINQVLSSVYLLHSIEEPFNLLYQSPMLPTVVIYPAKNCVYRGIAVCQGWIYNTREENVFCLPLNAANLVKVGYIFKKKPPPPSKSPRLKELLACPTQESSLSSAPVVESQVDVTISPVESQVDKVLSDSHQTNIAGTSEEVEVDEDNNEGDEKDEDPSIAEMTNSPYYVRKG